MTVAVFIGNFDFVVMNDLNVTNAEGVLVNPLSGSGWQSGRSHPLTIPPIIFFAFQMMFAIITPALITGATAERLKFSAYAARHRPLVDARVLAARPLGVQPRPAGCSSGACSTSRAARWST